MTPGKPYYFNGYEDEEREITPLAYGDNIMGVQANLWAEYVVNGEVAEYMTFPRLCALSETGWSPGELKDYKDFIQRLKINSKQLDVLHVNYSKYFMNEK